MAIDVERRDADRLRVLRAVFDAAAGTTSEVVRTAPTIQLQLGLSHQELQAACDYLTCERLIEPVATIDEAPVYIAVQLTHRGVVRVEKTISSPNRPAGHAAATSVIQIINSTIINSPIQNASPAARQTTSADDVNVVPGNDRNGGQGDGY